MRQRILPVIGCVLLFFVIDLPAQTGDTGLGVRLGEPTGISAKIMTRSSRSMNFAAAWSLGSESRLVLQGDYVFYDNDILNLDIDRGTLPLYYGLGVHLKLADEPEIGVRVPLGVNLFFSENPLGIFFEIAPTLQLVPATRIDLYGGIGVHYYF